MVLSEYRQDRAEALFRLNIPDIESPIHIKILWLDNLTYQDIGKRNCQINHAHSFFEIHFVFSGRMVYECGGRTVELSANQALLIPPGVPHQYLKCDRALEKAVLAFSIGEHLTLPMSFDGLKCKAFPFSGNIAENVNFILKKSDERDIFFLSILSGRVLEMISSVCKSLKISLPMPLGKELDARVLVAKEYIEKHKNRIINCEDVAKECCLSLKQLNRIFKQDTGSSVFDYIIAVRMKYAKKLLRQGERSIKQVSFLMGFENESSFVSFFKRHCGIPPGAFRKQTSENQEKVSEN